MQHCVALSVVGSERRPESGYLRAKLEQERLIRDSGIPYTILRATQFLEFVGSVAQSATVGSEIRLPMAYVQPVFSRDVSELISKLATEPPVNGMIELAGPELIPMAEWVERYLRWKHDTRSVVRDDNAHYFGTRLESRSLVPAGPSELGSCRLEDWLASLVPQT